MKVYDVYEVLGYCWALIYLVAVFIYQHGVCTAAFLVELVVLVLFGFGYITIYFFLQPDVPFKSCKFGESPFHQLELDSNTDLIS